MLKIKNRSFSPIQLTFRTNDRKKLTTSVLPSRGVIETDEMRKTPMMDELKKRGLISITYK